MPGFAIIATIAICCTSAFTVLPLGTTAGVDWNAISGNASIAVKATVPGQIHMDLAAAGVIADPNVGWSELLQRWIASDNFTYSCEMAVPTSVLSAKNVDLVLPGVDTYAVVLVNGNVVLTAENMHREFIVPVKSFIVDGNNSVVLKFTGPVPQSAITESECRGAYCPAPWAGPAPNPIVNNAYLRKEQDSFSWDFAPATGTTGIWREPRLVAYEDALLQHAMFAAAPAPGEPPSGRWVANFTARLWASSAPPPGGARLTLSATIGGLPGPVGGFVSFQLLGEGYTVASVLVNVSRPPLWWPNGYGAQPLFAANLTLLSASDGSVQAVPFRVGFRTVRLDQSPAPRGRGNLYRFVVNDRPVLSRGSNWVPANSLQGRVTPASLAWLVAAFRDARFNMLRVWGGGVYASEELLDLADEMGILITHDAMFGDQFYSTDPGFLAGVAAEVQDAAWRMGRHASLALWSGNNEMATGYVEHGLWADAAYYSELYFGTVLSNLSAVDPTRDAMSSCPSMGNNTAAVPFQAGDSSTIRGDMHFYNTSGDCWVLSQYPRARFISEHGSESWPSLLTLAPTLEGPQDYGFNASLPFSRNHHPPGQREMTQTVTEHWLWPSPPPAASAGTSFKSSRYRRLRGNAAVLAAAHRQEMQRQHLPTAATQAVPPVDALAQEQWIDTVGASNGSAQQYRDELWATQVAAATCVRIGAELWRRASDEFDSDGVGGTAGILYWQANDIWPAPSWSGIEWGGRPKVLHHYAAAFFAPLLVSGFLDAGWDPNSNATANATAGTLHVHLSNSAYAPGGGGGGVPNGTLRLSMWSWAAGLLTTWEVPVMAPQPHFSQELYAVPLSAALARAGCASAAHCVLALNVLNGTDAAAAPVVAHNWVYLSSLSAVTTMPPSTGLAVVDVAEAEPTGDGRYRVFNVTVAAERLPVAVPWLETALHGRFDRLNGMLLTESPAVLQWTTDELGVTSGQLAASLVVWSLSDVADYGADYGTLVS